MAHSYDDGGTCVKCGTIVAEALMHGKKCVPEGYFEPAFSVKPSAIKQPTPAVAKHAHIYWAPELVCACGRTLKQQHQGEGIGRAVANLNRGYEPRMGCAVFNPAKES